MMPDHSAEASSGSTWSSISLACLAVVLVSLLLARISIVVQSQWSPFLLLPLVCGGLLGAGLWLIHRALSTSRRWLLALAVAGGVLLSVGQHYFAYRQYVHTHEQKRQTNPQIAFYEQAMGRIKPLSFGSFLQFSARERSVGPVQLQGTQVWLSWVLDVVLTVGAAVVVVWQVFRSRRTLE